MEPKKNQSSLLILFPYLSLKQHDIFDSIERTKVKNRFPISVSFIFILVLYQKTLKDANMRCRSE